MVSDLVSQNINIFLRNTVKVTGVVVFMFSLSWQLSLVTFMGFPIIMMVSNIYGKYYKVGAIRSPGCACVCLPSPRSSMGLLKGSVCSLISSRGRWLFPEHLPC